MTKEDELHEKRHDRAEEMEERAVAAYKALEGKVVWIKSAVGYYGASSSMDVFFQEPVLARIDHSAQDFDIVRWTAKDAIDPVYGIVVIDDPDDQLRGLRSLWCYGDSYIDINDGIREEVGDVIRIATRRERVVVWFKQTGRAMWNVLRAALGLSRG